MMKQFMQIVTNEVSAFVKFIRQTKDLSNRANFLVVALACLCVVLPLDVSQLAFAVVGALAFSFLQSIQPKQKQRASKSSEQKSESPRTTKAPRPAPSQYPVPSQYRVERQRPHNRSPQSTLLPPTKEVRKPSAEPVQAPSLIGTDWDMQVVELLKQIAPTVEDDKLVSKLAGLVKKAIKPMIPEVEVVGFASGDLTRKKAFGVAVPEVDIVANVNPMVLAERVGGRVGGRNQQQFDPKKLQKSAIRACTDRLVSSGGFKFRRSAFRGEEPKVTLLAAGVGADAIPVDFTVNAVSPLHNAALLTESGQMEPRARELILLVKRWAKDRGICHAAKGHLPPYVWTILSIFFLQAGMPNDESLLPSLDGFKTAKKLAGRSSGDDTKSSAASTGSDKKTAQLLVDFMQFYHEHFDWKNEAISLRQAKRSKPGLKLPLHIIVDENGKSTSIGPSIEDPFDEAHNLGSVMTTISLERLREELARAHKLCSSGNGSLVELLEPWAPPEQDSESQSRDEAEPAPAEKIAAEPAPAEKVAATAPWQKKIVA